MKLAFILGFWSTGTHGKLNPRELYVQRALTGSESSFFNVARDLAARGHRVSIFCDTDEEIVGSAALDGADIFHIDRTIGASYDAYVSLNEPDMLKRAPKDKMRICWQQMGDIPPHSDSHFNDYVDLFVALSPVHRDYIKRTSGASVDPAKWRWIPNSTNLEFFADPLKARDPRSMIWCSSPDRGLHRLLEIYPQIRERVPEATLGIYYRFDPWYELVRGMMNANGDRARYIHKCLEQLGRNGENGVTLYGPTPNVEMAQRLLGAGVLPYTCDVTRFTESFSVSILDACAAGCVPIISDADAIGDIYCDVAHIIPGKPGDSRSAWVDAIVRAMTDPTWSAGVAARATEFAQFFGRGRVSGLWQELLENSNVPMPATIADYIKEQKELDALAPPVEAPAIVSEPEMLPELPPPAPLAPLEPLRPSIPLEIKSRPLRLAVIMGKLGSPVHGIVDAENAFEGENQFVTGTVAGFFNIVWGLAERGHIVDAFADVQRTVVGCARFGGANFYPLDAVTIDVTYDAYISINEPDMLRGRPEDRLRICANWLNDFSFCQPGWDPYVDVYACPSQTHLDYLANTTGTSRAKLAIVPLSVNPEFFMHSLPRRTHSIAYCSSPDRGLHHLLEWFPEIRERVPDASLRIYYRVQPWYERVVHSNDNPPGSVMRDRAERLWRALDKLGRDGENGVYLVGPVPQRTMARELCQTNVLAYTCDPTRFTEGFCVTVMDACAAGTVPIIAGVDALPEMYWNAAHIIPGNARDHKQEWIDAIVRALTDSDFAAEVRTSAKAHARNFTRQHAAVKWEALVRERIR